MRLFLLGLLLGLIGVMIGGYLYFSLGYAPVATAAPSMPFEKTMAKMAMHARIAREAPATAPIAPDEPNLMAGALIYRNSCSMCHGMTGQPQSPIAAGMFPKPPHLFTGKGVTDDPVGETYWKTRYGIRLSGMPAFGQAMSEQQLWQVSLLLAHSDKLPVNVKNIVSGPPAPLP